MRRVVAAALLVAALAAAAGWSSSTRPAAQAAGKAENITIWVGWSARELKAFKSIVAEYDRKHSDVNVKVVGGINDDKITAAIRSGNVPDVVSSFTSSNVGTYCSTGAWIDLGPLLAKDHVDVNLFPATTRYYTQYKGKRCALPFLADVYGLYYNKTLFKKAGIKSPPKTFSELTADAKKLTQRSGGKIKVIGYDPFWSFYSGNFTDMTNYAPLFGAQYYNGKGKAVLASRFAWSKLL